MTPPIFSPVASEVAALLFAEDEASLDFCYREAEWGCYVAAASTSLQVTSIADPAGMIAEE
jgi:hypothetical protein